MSNTKTSQAIGLVVWLAICFLPAGASMTSRPDAWYRGLNHPQITPPDAVFGPVWTLLYISMALAAWLIWKQDGFATAKWPLLWFLLQLVLNAIWPWLFFGQHQIGLALVDIVALVFAIAVTAGLFFGRHRWAGLLMIPYLGWVAFASVLNYLFWDLNQT